MAEINDTLAVPRPPAVPRSFSQAFWDGTRQKKILLQYDTKAGKYQFLPRPTSIYTGLRRVLEWREVSGRGEVFSFTITRRGADPFRGFEPYFVTLVTLDEGVNIMANIVNCSLDEMKIGLRVKPYWHPLPAGTHLLMFEPDRG